ncbi:hypothetical protein [uncultured Microscilla sp.]|uniref:hypothetical protein n=1 Tax=uncultured Microscilla sp. TaxID=432653 RepID=UPI00260DB2DB|nr:hypothetical protein [uncultured Microscilla sp.]
MANRNNDLSFELSEDELWMIDDKKFEEHFDEGEIPTVQEKKPQTGYKKAGVFYLLNDIGDIFGKAVDIRNKILHGPQGQNQPPTGINYQPRPQKPAPKKNHLPLVAGGAVLCLAGVLIYQKTKSG